MELLRRLFHLSGFLCALLLWGGCSQGRVVYHHADVLGGQYDLYVVREDGTNRAVLANSLDDETACGVTTDRRIVFTRHTVSGGDIYLVNEDGTGLLPLRTSSDDEVCFGVTGHNMVVFGITVGELNHDLYSIAANASSTDAPITLSASALDDLPVAIGLDNRILYAKQEVTIPIEGHRYSFYSVADDGTQPGRVVGVLEEPTFVAISPGNRMIWRRSGPLPNGGLFSTTIDGLATTAALNRFLHNLGWTEDRFCGFTPQGRVALTSRGVYPVDGISTDFGSIYLMNVDATNAVHINPGPRQYNELCLGATDTWVIVARYPDDQDVSRITPTSLWSYPTNGMGQPTELVNTHASNQSGLSFEGITPQGRVLFSTYDQSRSLAQHQSINPDGSGLVTLATSRGGASGFTYFSNVLYSVQGQQYDLDVVEASGNRPLAPLASQPVENWLSFIFVTNAFNQASRCRACWSYGVVDRGGIPLPSLPPFP